MNSNLIYFYLVKRLFYQYIKYKNNQIFIIFITIENYKFNKKMN